MIFHGADFTILPFLTLAFKIPHRAAVKISPFFLSAVSLSAASIELGMSGSAETAAPSFKKFRLFISSPLN